MKNKYIYLAIATVPVLISIIGVFILLISPYTGLNFEQKNGKWYIVSIDTGSPASAHPELHGKEILSIADYPIKKYDLEKEFDDIPTRHELANYWDARNYFSQNVKPSVPFKITITDGKVQTSFHITPSYLPLWTIFTKSSIIFLLTLTHIGLGVLILFKKPNDLTARLFFLAMILVAIMTASLGILHASDVVTDTHILQIAYITHASVNIFATAIITHFLMIFPRDIYIEKHKWILKTLYLTAAIALFIYLFRLIPGIHYLFVLFCMAITIVFLIANYSQFNSVERSQVKWFYMGFSLFLFIDLFTYILPPLFIGHRLMNEGEMLIFGLLFPLSMVFAIMKYRLMDIDTLFDNTIIYTTTLALLAIMDIAVITTLVNFKILKLYSPFTLIASVWLIIFTYIPVRNFAQKWIKKILKREIYDINAVSMQLSKELLSAPDIKSSYDKVIHAISHALHPKGNELYLFDQYAYITIGNSRIDIKRVNAPVHLYNTVNIESLPKNYSGGVCVPITGTQKSLGCFILQDKQSGRLYDSEDIKLLSIAASQLAMAIEALRSREELHKKEIELIKEKERISRELHDGIGSSLVQAKLLIDSDKDNKIILKELKLVVDEGIQEMRELIWVVEKGESTLADLIFYIESKLARLKDTIKINITSDIEHENIALSPEKKLNIVRIIQESITNVIKHAQAELIGIEFTEHDNVLTINITDNGKGFDIATQKQGSYGLRNMQKRCAEIEGEFKVISEVGKGTTISVVMNLK